MLDVSVTGVVRAAPQDVFRFLADLENWPRWQSDMKSTTWRSARGARSARSTDTSPSRELG